MKNWSKLIPALCVLLTGFLFTNRADAQCTVKLVGAASGCSPYLATFERTDGSGKTIASVDWSFGSGSASSTDTFYQINFATPGSYKVNITVNYADGSTPCHASVAQTIVVFAPPIAKINLPTDPVYGPIQCFKRNGQLNSFTFTESSIPGSSGAPIVQYFWNFGDGDTSTVHNPKHSYQSPGTYNVSLRVLDSNGCRGYDTIIAHIVVLKDIGTTFKQNGTLACNKDSVQFLNTTDTIGLKLKAFYRDFGDGSGIDSTNYNPSHIFTPGKYTIALTIENALGCTATDTQTITVAKFEIKIFFKDTMCWTDAHNSGVIFVAEPQPTADLWTWNFDDPNSGPNDIVNFNWTQGHKFIGGPSAGGNPATAYTGVGGPGIYDVNFSVHSQTCGRLDTCFYVHILGPMAFVTTLPSPPAGPFPPNDTVPPVQVPKSDFLAINADHSSCDVNFIKYITFRKLQNVPVAHWSYHFCNADTALNAKGKKDITTSFMADCKGKRVIPYAWAITLKPTDSTATYYKDSVADTTIWQKGQPLPNALLNAKKVYYPGGGQQDFNDMNDSNLVTCSLPNLVRFTNNSIKWRLHYAIDDNTWQNVLDPSHSFRDTCRWKNYPMASDSLVYYWQFNDPSGVKCTSTPSNKNWDCNFSTIAAPYHYYRGTKGLPPSSCQTVSLSVFDPVTNCKDSLYFQLKQGPPVAGWNKLAYCKMTWEMQEDQLAPKGSPGPAGPPMIGFMLTNQPNPCAGFEYPFRIDFSQTIPTCGAENWWAVFDSANVVKYKHCPGGDSVLDYGFTGDLGPGYSPALQGYPSGAPAGFWNGLPWQGRYWYNVGDTGCKTVGIVLQNGKCFDTAWYHDYICFNKLNAFFDIYNVVPPGKGHSTQNNIPGDTFGYTQVFVDSSETGHGHVCTAQSPNPFGTSDSDIREGVRLYLFPHDTNQSDVTAFRYNITRNIYGDNPAYTNSGGQWYYNYAPHGVAQGFWPDSASLNPFTTASDSVAQVLEHVNYIDTPHIYVIIPPTANNIGLPPKRILLNFPIYGTDTTGELDSLITRDSVGISVNDERARRIDAICGKPFIEVYTDPGFKVVGHTQLLRLGGFKAVDSFITQPVTPTSGPELTIPYPGFYTIDAISANLEGCQQSSEYLLVYGHYATFWVNDSVICLGQPTVVHFYVRYWSTNCLGPPGGGPPPPGCLNGADELVPGLNNTVDFNPWDSIGAPGGPTAYRDTLSGGLWKTNPAPNYHNETIALNFGEPGDTEFHSFPPRGNVAPAHTYTKPGVYTIIMKTVDWRGCAVYTVRRNLMKVIEVTSAFKLQHPSDTLTYCPPKSITYLDSSYIQGNKYTEKVVKSGQLVDSTFIVDSIQYRVWKTGDGRTIVKPGFETQFVADYVKADSLNITLTVLSSHTCNDSLRRDHLVTIIGPEPKFELLGNKAGCYPFTAHVHILSHDRDVQSYTWDFGDPKKPKLAQDLPSDTNAQTLTALDTVKQLPYKADTGRFRLHMTEVDTFRDISGKPVPCFKDYPDSTDKNQIFVTVYPNSPITINGDTLLCVDKISPYNVTSKFHEYKFFSWWVNPQGPAFPNDTVFRGKGDSVQMVQFSKLNYLNALAVGDSDANGNAVFTLHVRAESDTGPVPPDTTGCIMEATYNVHVQDSHAGFSIDLSQQNQAKFTFHDSSQHVKNYILDYGDGDSINTLQPHFSVTHTYNNLTGGNNVPEGSVSNPPNPSPWLTQFKVTLTTYSPFGCKDTMSKYVRILREFDHYNVFTPNSSDTINSRFAPFIKGQVSSILKIYNRWGQLVFQSKGSNTDTAWSKDASNTWDGNDQGNGQPCPEGTYYYVWSFELVGGEKKTINGAVTLIR